MDKYFAHLLTAFVACMLLPCSAQLSPVKEKVEETTTKAQRASDASRQAALIATPLIVAHRGASKAAPENTLPAFMLAWEKGAGAIEGDFHLSQDGQVVCIHDADTKKTGNRNIEVKHSSLAELQTVDVGAWHSKGFKGTAIPTLAEVIATVPKGKKIYIEIKSDASIVPHLLKVLADSELKQEQVVVISFHSSVIKRIETEAPEVTTYLLNSFKRKVTGGRKPSNESVLATLKACKADGLSTNTFRITEKFIKQVQDLGYSYHVYTVDNANEAKRLAGWGVQSITTNLPGKIGDMIRN